MRLGRERAARLPPPFELMRCLHPSTLTQSAAAFASIPYVRTSHRRSIIKRGAERKCFLLSPQACLLPLQLSLVLSPSPLYILRPECCGHSRAQDRQRRRQCTFARVFSDSRASRLLHKRRVKRPPPFASKPAPTHHPDSRFLRPPQWKKKRKMDARATFDVPWG